MKRQKYNKEKPQATKMNCNFNVFYVREIAYLENVYSILLFLLENNSGAYTAYAQSEQAAFSQFFSLPFVVVVVVFENASCRMAINAHSWKLLSLFTQQQQQTPVRHLEMGKKKRNKKA